MYTVEYPLQLIENVINKHTCINYHHPQIKLFSATGLKGRLYSFEENWRELDCSIFKFPQCSRNTLEILCDIYLYTRGDLLQKFRYLHQ